MKQECKKCFRRYNVLTEEGLCFHCHVKKYKAVPTKGCYDTGKGSVNPMGFKKRKEKVPKKKKKKGMGKK